MPQDEQNAAPLKLNLGSGVHPEGKPTIPGFIDVDRKLGSEVYPLDYADESVDEIRASHVLEHFAQSDVKDVLDHWVKKLKPGGLLRIAVPNFKAIAEGYLKGVDAPIMGYVMGGQIDPDDFHKTAFDPTLLVELMMSCGLQGLRKWDSEIDDCARKLGPFTLNIMGYKPSTDDKQLNNVGGILAAPRNGYIIHQYCTTRAMAQLQGLEFNVIQSCFWWTELCTGMEQWLDKGKEFVLTLDYDSVFSHEDVLELYRILKSDETIDAVVALQARRGCDDVLFSFGKDGPREVQPDIFSWRTTPVKTGHFGLTMFRASSLKRFPHPWMTPKPGNDGKWSDKVNRVDVDMDFWHRWEQAGFNLHLANRVAIGHIEEFIKWPSITGKPIVQSVKDYGTSGKPAETWR